MAQPHKASDLSESLGAHSGRPDNPNPDLCAFVHISNKTVTVGTAGSTVYEGSRRVQWSLGWPPRSRRTKAPQAAGSI